MLVEINEAGVLYVRRSSRWQRTVEALQRQGFVECVESDYLPLGINGWAAIDL